MHADIWMQNVDGEMLQLPNLIDLPNQKYYRIIPSAYPPINFFEDLVDPSEVQTLWEIEGLTNIFLVAPEDRISGEGSSLIMNAFTHLSSTRFSDGSYGVYYAG